MLSLKRGRYWEVLRNTETAMLGLKRGSCCSPRSEPEATSSLRRSPEERWVKPYLQEFEVETQNEDFIKDGGLLFCEFAQRIQIFVVVQPWPFLPQYCLICILKTLTSSVSKTYPSTLSSLVFPNFSWFSSVSGTQYSCSPFGNNQTSQKVTSPYERLNTLSNTWQRSCCTGFPCFDWLVVCFFSYERLNSYLATILSHWVPLPQPGPPSTQTMGRPEAVRAEQSTGYGEFRFKPRIKISDSRRATGGWFIVFNSKQQ